LFTYHNIYAPPQACAGGSTLGIDCSAAQEVLDGGPEPVLLIQLAGRDGVNRKPLLLTRRPAPAAQRRPTPPLTEVRRPSPPAGPRPPRGATTGRPLGISGDPRTPRDPAAATAPEAAAAASADAARIAREVLPAMGRVARSRRLRPAAEAFEVRRAGSHLG
jgi:hypothetical protein